MLTDSDLLKIQKLVRSEIHNEVELLIYKVIEPLWIEIKEVKKEIVSLYFADNYINLEKRVDIIEDHLKLSQVS